MKKYFKIWWKYTVATSQIAFASRIGAAIFITGKLLRFAFFLLFLIIIIFKTKTLAGYNLWQVIFFFATFNFIDTLVQFFLREVYRFRWQIVSGSFDFVLVKPFSPLFRSLLGGSDVLDLSILIISFIFIVVAAINMGSISFLGIILYALLVLNALVVALAFHIGVLGLGVLTTEVDHSVMLYRDLTQMGRFPIDIYKEPLRGLLTFAIPVGIMMTFPAKAIMGLLSWQFILLSFWIGGVFLYLSIVFWHYALRHYASASS